MQRAIFVTEVGKSLSLGTRAIPSPPKGYVQINVTATQLLPHDTYGRDAGLFIASKLPFVLGTNIAGTVTAFGPDSSPSDYEIGDAIFGLGNPFYPTPDMSGLQEYALLDISASAKIPAGFTPEQVVTFPVNAVTSFEALFHPTNGFGFPAPFAPTAGQGFAYATQNILVIGGGSNVGKLGIQFAKLVGVGRIISIASRKNEAGLKALGATHVVDRHQEPAKVVKAVHTITGSEGVTHVYDCVSWEYSLALSLDIASGGGCD
jgi:NADPH:quinone reductase